MSPETQPLLTIAIPTCDRAPLLESLLAVLVPQLTAHPDVRLLILDNGSTDDTPNIIARYASSQIHAHRHPVNIGSDANFVSAFQLSTGRYFWLCGDDDLPIPPAVNEIMGHLRTTELDLIYLTSYGFRENWSAERQSDPLQRRFHTITDPRRLTIVVNMMFTFISGMIVNRERLLALPSEGLQIEAPEAFLGTNLTQLSWTLPLLRRHRRSLVIWNRPIAARQGHNGGYALAEVFGERLVELTLRCLPDRPDLAHLITNFAIRRWFPSIIYDIRQTGNQTFSLDRAQATLTRVFGRNPRYWIFTYPILKLPLPLAKIWLRAGEALSKVIYSATVPGFWRKQS